MTSWAELLTDAGPGEHVVQLYGRDDQLLTRNASRYLAEGLRRGDGIIVVATPEHTRAIGRHLEEEPAAARAAEEAGRLVYRDAERTLASLCVDGRPDIARFRSVVGQAIAEVRARSTTGAVRAFGEMVSLLWDRGERDEAATLEGMWNTVLHEYGCSLFCAYTIDLFHQHDDAAALHPIVASHHHILAGSGTLLTSGRPRP